MDDELKARLERTLVACEQMMEAVRELEKVEAESHQRNRVKKQDGRVDALEKSGE